MKKKHHRVSRRTVLGLVPTAIASRFALDGSSAKAQAAPQSPFSVLGIAHAAALVRQSTAALGGTLSSLLIAESGGALTLPVSKDWSSEELKKHRNRIDELSQSVREASLDAYRRSVGIPSIGSISQVVANANIVGSVLVSGAELVAKDGSQVVGRVAQAVELAITAPMLDELIGSLSKDTKRLDQVVKTFSAAGSPIELRASAEDAAKYLPPDARNVILQCLGKPLPTPEELTAGLGKKLGEFGAQFDAEVRNLKKAADSAVTLFEDLRTRASNFQSYSATLSVVAGFADSLGASDLARDLSNAASFVQQSYAVYQMFAVGTMGPVAALSILSAGSPFGGATGGSSTAVEQVMFEMLLGELKAMRQEFRQRFVAIDKKLDQIAERLEQTYQEVAKGNRIALKNFGEIRRDIQGVISAVEGIAREKDMNEFLESLGLLTTALQLDDKASIANQLSNVHSYAHYRSYSSYFVGKPFQDEPLRTKVARYRSAELLIGCTNHVLDLTGAAKVAAEAPNPVEWARGTFMYLEALESRPELSIPKIKADLISLWEDGRRIQQTVLELTGREAISGAVYGYAGAVAEPELWQGQLGKPPASAPKPAPRPLRVMLREALGEFIKGFYPQPSRRPIPTRVVQGMIGKAAIPDLFTVGRFYLSWTEPLVAAFRFDGEERDPLLAAQRRGVIDITEVQKWKPLGFIADADQLEATLYTIKVLKGKDTGRVFGAKPTDPQNVSNFQGLLKFVDQRPDLNGAGQRWFWNPAYPTDRFKNNTELMDYCVNLILLDEIDQVHAGLAYWLQESKLKVEALVGSDALTTFYEFASALKVSVSFAQWRMRAMEFDDASSVPKGGTWSSTAVDNVDVPSTPDELWGTFNRLLQDVLNASPPSIAIQGDVAAQSEPTHWQAFADRLVANFVDHLLGKHLLRYLAMPSQLIANQGLPIADAAMRQLAVSCASRAIKLDYK